MSNPGATPPSPWVWQGGDYLDRAITITVTYNNTTLLLTGATVARDNGCLFTKIVLDNPTDDARAKRITAPADGAGPRTYTKNQLNNVGLVTYADIAAVQCTAER